VSSKAVMTAEEQRPRCGWATATPEYIAYHDDEWGRPLHGERALFERLSLEAFQSGLSWLIILRKRPAFRAAFDGFDVDAVAQYDEADVARLLADAGIVRNRLKVRGTVTNARAFIAVQAEHGTFADYLWSWVGGTPIVNHPRSMGDLPAHTELSDRLGKALKRQGFTFVGTTIVYSFLQAVGLVDDHIVGCPWKTGGGIR
jgi:DNA-3-methyladenine glycosylase I